MPTQRQAAVLARARARAKAVDNPQPEPLALLSVEEVRAPAPPTGPVRLLHTVACQNVPGTWPRTSCGWSATTEDGALAEEWARRHSGQGLKGGPRPPHTTTHSARPITKESTP